MSKVYGFCKAGCKYPVVKEDDFLKAAAFIEMDTNVLDIGNKYKVFDKGVNSWLLKIVFKFKMNYRGNVSEQTVNLTLPIFDKYNPYLTIKLCDVKLNDLETSMSIVYDVNDERKTQTYNTGDHDASIVTGSIVCEVINADKIYLLNETGGYTVNIVPGTGESSGSGNINVSTITDLTNTTWTLKDPFNVDDEVWVVTVDFTSNGQKFKAMIYTPGSGLQYITDGEDVILVYAEYTNNIDTTYKSFTITGGDDVTNKFAIDNIQYIANLTTGGSSSGGNANLSNYITKDEFNTIANATQDNSEAIASMYTKSEVEDYVDTECNNLKDELSNVYYKQTEIDAIYDELDARLRALESIPVYNGEVE